MIPTEFLNYENKYAILLALTSNNGAVDFQLQNDLYLSEDQSLKMAKC